MSGIPDLDLYTKHISDVAVDTEPQFNIKPADSSSSSEDIQLSGRDSPPPNCTICLGRCRNKCVADLCLHQFCFNCLLEWSKVKPVCPLCKHTLTVIRYNIKSNNQFEEYKVPHTVQDSSDVFSTSSDDSDFESTNNENSDETSSVVELDSTPITISDQSTNNFLSSSTSDECEFVSISSGTTNRTSTEMAGILQVNPIIDSHSHFVTDTDEYLYCNTSTPKKLKIDGGVGNANADPPKTTTTCILKPTNDSLSNYNEEFNQGASTSSGLQISYRSKRAKTSKLHFNFQVEPCDSYTMDDRTNNKAPPTAENQNG